MILIVWKAKEDHHAVAVITGEKVKGVVHFYQLNGPTSAVKVVGKLDVISVP